MARTEKRRVIAVEEHFATEQYWREIEDLAVAPGEEIEQEFVLNFPKNPRMRLRLSDIPTRLSEMDTAGVDLSVLSLNPPGVQLYADAARATELARGMNDTLADIIRRHPGRFAGLGAVAPQDPEAAAAEVSRVMGTPGFGGILIGSHTHGHYLDEPEMEPLLAALEREDATLYLHPRSPSPQMLAPFRDYGMVAALWGFQAEVGTHAIRLILSGTLDRHPNLRIVLGHLGEGLPFWLWRLDNIHEKTYRWAGDLLGMAELELKPSEYVLRNFTFTTSGMCDPDVFAYTLGKVGAERLMFAVDYPYEDSHVATAFLDALDLTDEQRALVSHANAERLFRVPRTATRE
ncbi:amidohydrolase family protein [Streptomyces sp. SL13]|uniref:Amidohydrolase family protein n=1 Tax=Streptantibioticus silvisoli TaxID=2705255 RepID=A0AA90HAQ7_9ACTN|nr:amidohydrolase family protein [Streptantibioticus silvisoli]MDI5973142.1 amidohydrolase family protein [Streptantibioticus silvisoli]